MIPVQALEPCFEAQAQQWQSRLGLPSPEDLGLILELGAQGLQLRDLGPEAPGPVRVDFVEGAAAHRRQFGGGSGQMIAKAVGIQPGIRPNILDATAGLGRDAFVLATLGCSMTLIERQPVIAALLADGLERALQSLDIQPIIQRMRLVTGNAISLMQHWSEVPPQVIYLDPMFPHRDKSALVKKEMRLFRPLVGDDEDAVLLLESALALASHRVVVKRPRKAPCISGPTPSLVLEGKSSRYDIYPKRSLKTLL
ncbi:16S rRNA (guanine1516-N2)-methyltransferase [Azomonas agilis]|uniref:Ribosomal RNA small subunit methyltransferase J n=1 Tax=Azomonas agilis TaxID=116849 RepID=A0A562J2F8_9GAMM|nr:16S rRNA (guanine1516-N2)-methyltransferase [Azomonas agilis]